MNQCKLFIAYTYLYTYTHNIVQYFSYTRNTKNTRLAVSLFYFVSAHAYTLTHLTMLFKFVLLFTSPVIFGLQVSSLDTSR